MGDVNGAGSEQQGLAPGAEPGDVGGEGGDHRGNAFDVTGLHEWEFGQAIDGGKAGDSRFDGGARFAGGADETNHQLRGGMVGDDVWSAAAFDESDVEGAGTDFRIDGQLDREDAVEGFDEHVRG